MALAMKTTCCPQVMLKEPQSGSFKDVGDISVPGGLVSPEHRVTVLLVACRCP